MLVSEFDYALPEELIAQRPAPERTASRLLHLDARSGEIEDLAFAELPAQLGGGDTVVLNDTRGIKARLPGRKRTGGRIEGFIDRKSVVEGKRVDLGGRRIIKKKKKRIGGER